MHIKHSPCRVFIVASKHRGHFSRVRNIVEVIPVSGYPCVRNGGSISLTRDNRLRVQSPSRTNIEAPEKSHGTRERVFFRDSKLPSRHRCDSQREETPPAVVSHICTRRVRKIEISQHATNRPFGTVNARCVGGYQDCSYERK